MPSDVPMPQSRGRCIFCAGGNLSKEHFWPDWARSLLADNPPGPFVERTLLSEGTVQISETIKRTRTGSAVSKKIRVVCIGCNSGWLSRLECDAKPLLADLAVGRVTEIAAENQSVLARWIAAKVFVAEHNSQHDVVSTQAERANLMHPGVLPRNFKIWIAHCPTLEWKTAYSRSAAKIRESWNPSIERQRNIHTTTFGFGALVVHVIHTTLNEMVIDLPDLTQRGVLRLYPFQATLAWPPSIPIPGELAAKLSFLLNETVEKNSARNVVKSATCAPPTVD